MTDLNMIATGVGIPVGVGMPGAPGGPAAPLATPSAAPSQREKAKMIATKIAILVITTAAILAFGYFTCGLGSALMASGYNIGGGFFYGYGVGIFTGGVLSPFYPAALKMWRWTNQNSQDIKNYLTETFEITQSCAATGALIGVFYGVVADIGKGLAQGAFIAG